MAPLKIFDFMYLCRSQIQHLAAFLRLMRLQV